MTKKSRRSFLRDAATLLVLPAASTIVPAALEDILGVNDVEAQNRPRTSPGGANAGQFAPGASTSEHLTYTIHLRNFDTHSILGRISQPNVGVANFNIIHTPTRYRINAASRIDAYGSWVLLNSVVSGAFSYEDGTPQFQPQYYWLHYEEGGRGSTAKEFLSDIHFDFNRYQASSYGFHHEELVNETYGTQTSRIVEPITSSTRDIISAIMEARFLPAQRRRQINTVISGRSEGMWLEYLGRARFQPTRTDGYPTRMFRLYFRPGILPESNRSYDLMMQIHEGDDRTPVSARHIKSEESEVQFILRNHTAKLTGISLYPPPQGS